MSLHLAQGSEMTARLLELSKELATAERLAVAMAAQVKRLDEENRDLALRVTRLQARLETFEAQP